jgi:hypothetical protein
MLAEMINSCDLYARSMDHQQDNRFLFPGTSCFPLTPCDEMKEKLSEGGGQGNEGLNIVGQ